MTPVAYGAWGAGVACRMLRASHACGSRVVLLW